MHLRNDHDRSQEGRNICTSTIKVASTHFLPPTLPLLHDHTQLTNGQKGHAFPLLNCESNAIDEHSTDPSGKEWSKAATARLLL
jgi:hypothetical protein